MYNTRHYESTVEQGSRYRVLLATKLRRNHRQASGQRGKVGDDASAASGSAIGYEALSFSYISKNTLILLLYLCSTNTVGLPIPCLPCAASHKEGNGVLGILCVSFGPLFSCKEENRGLGIPLRSLWPTLHCRRVAGVSPLLSIDWWYLSSVSPKRHCCRVSAADKGCRVYPLDPHPDAVTLYSGCTPDIPVSIVPLKSPNSCRGIFSEPDLLTTTDVEILDGFSSQGVIYDCILEPECINCYQARSADSELCPKWRTKKEIQEIKTNKNISYVEARKLIVPQLVQTYTHAAKPSIVSNSKQTNQNITKIKCPPLKLLQPLLSLPKPNTLISIPAISESSSSIQAKLLPSTSFVTVTLSSESQPPIPLRDTAPTSSNSLFISAASSSCTACPVLEATATASSAIPATSQDTKQTSKPRGRKRPPKNRSNDIKPNGN
ncbi:uncharacterized protein TNCV_382511 [Trichonephila clavipes]|nr:uncharacterized protein TNCV_382511 [Trichonephila clavipes]